MRPRTSPLPVESGTINVMRCVTDPDVVTFADQVLQYLLRDPVANNVAYTIVAERNGGGRPPEPDAIWLRLLDTPPDGPESGAPAHLVGVALRTPPHPLLLTDMPLAGVDALVDHLAAAHPELPAVNGPIELSGRFAHRWTALTGASASSAFPQRTFRLDAVTPPTGVAGRLREATVADRPLLVGWAEAFAAEATPDDPPLDVGGSIDARLAGGGRIWLWEVARAPVSSLWLHMPAAGVVRISTVYTPPALRGRGYASAMVAAASQHALDNGAAACTLNTDLANPTSNKIYQAIGYRPVRDTQIWRFTALAETPPERRAL